MAKLVPVDMVVARGGFGYRPDHRKQAAGVDVDKQALVIWGGLYVHEVVGNSKSNPSFSKVLECSTNSRSLEMFWVRLELEHQVGATAFSRQPARDCPAQAVAQFLAPVRRFRPYPRGGDARRGGPVIG